MSAQTIQQLAAARSLALGDGRYYSSIIPGVLPIIGYSAAQSVEIQRWGADFLAEGLCLARVAHRSQGDLRLVGAGNTEGISGQCRRQERHQKRCSGGGKHVSARLQAHVSESPASDRPLLVHERGAHC